MASFKETFPHPHAVLPVIHVQSEGHVIRNAAIAREAGADGVFLISMGGLPWWVIRDVKDKVKEQFGDLWVGVNYLEKHVDEVFKVVDSKTDGVWVDNAMIDEKEEIQTIADRVAQIRTEASRERQFAGLYFGGVAFKYIKPEVAREDLGIAARIASRYMDVVTTTGSATGSPPDVEKIHIMKSSIGDHPLAIASGISPDNIHQFRDIADAFLVSTSLLKLHTEEFDPAKVRALVGAVRG
jgi:predicted TIM-barrel enzyme